jgi:16S rRNA (cytosine967-C5)-methyltransferase
MSHAHNQLRVVRELWTRLHPIDRATPSRMQTLLADRRFGGRDRRLYRELLLTALRHARVLPQPQKINSDESAALVWAATLARACSSTRETETFRIAFAGDSAPYDTAADPLALMPEWFADECETGLPVAATAAALLARAPLWVRLQTDSPAGVLAEWRALGWTAEPHPALADAFKLPPETKVTSCPLYQAGHYEVQDAGSQCILADVLAAHPAPGPRWLDACAGAGGKTLQLARLLGPSARIDATDPRASALAELRARARRAGLANRIRTLDAAAAAARDYDGVLVDAPCTGSGTWRRSPHLMACTTRADLAASAKLQLAILGEASSRVRPGGLLVYATCSIARTENRSIAEAFLAEHGKQFQPAMPTRPIAPGVEDNDGFYMATFRRNS